MSSISSVSSTSSSNRITGLATGMDTDSMVKSMLSTEQSKIDKTYKEKQKLEWQQEAYVDIIKDLKEFQDDYLSISASNDTNMMKSASYSGTKATSGDENVLTATTYAGAITGVYKVKVDQVAEAAKMQSNAFTIKDPNGKDINATTATKLSDLGIEASEITIEVKGKTFKIDVNKTEDENGAKTETLSDLINNFRNAKADDNSSDVLGNYITVNYSELTGKLTIQTRDTGADAKLSITGTAANELGITTGAVYGQNAKVYIKSPGESDFTLVERSSNSFTIDNIQYNLIAISEVIDTNPINPEDGLKETTITVKADATETVERFKKFVEKYNKLVDKINGKLTEKKNYNYEPLTKAQEEEMEDDDIEKWNEKAKQGILRGDLQLTSILNGMREIFYSAVEGAGISITDIGISTYQATDGKLKIDEDKLKTALETRGDQVQKLFTQSSTDKNKKGILQKIDDLLDTYVGSSGSLIQKAGYTNTRWATSNTLYKNIQAKEEAIQELQNKYYTKQENYYKMFASLETAMNQLNSQANWLYSQLGMS
ncbi:MULTISPECIES: flagellar filament capping protein FliD [Clostridium]|jgi:flagellar hook-associated protein 2|uniref:Flagellar hook-associated protein 2 n=1 Tax=Clostridium thermopalmarium DSM 5974 TaxID=1121340 RepID=A0A2T0AX46_9CLOT|nr:flagellar filament capping protein FliD [Clostridium thermopalmarium]PRR75378.1 Flagellar hook-associated protein 2 [Clostridium thermopalmarium DSM 5974]PVZ24280.1 flagellar hook-associated protein 2 [Clostridium thermopalmarium DSM 5974]